jgi:hypothetical protein
MLIINFIIFINLINSTKKTPRVCNLPATNILTGI